VLRLARDASGEAHRRTPELAEAERAVDAPGVFLVPVADAPIPPEAREPGAEEGAKKLPVEPRVGHERAANAPVEVEREEVGEGAMRSGALDRDVERRLRVDAAHVPRERHSVDRLRVDPGVRGQRDEGDAVGVDHARVGEEEPRQVGRGERALGLPLPGVAVARAAQELDAGLGLAPRPALALARLGPAPALKVRDERAELGVRAGEHGPRGAHGAVGRAALPKSIGGDVREHRG
jgi:hypothetical protein